MHKEIPTGNGIAFNRVCRKADLRWRCAIAGAPNATG